VRLEFNGAIWFEAYVSTYLERDLQAPSAITALPDVRPAAVRLGKVLNQSELACDVAVAQPTVHRWLNLLQASLHHLPPPSLRHQPHQTADQEAQALLGRRGLGAARRWGKRAHRCPP
jgi:hypothetical protein